MGRVFFKRLGLIRFDGSLAKLEAHWTDQVGSPPGLTKLEDQWTTQVGSSLGLTMLGDTLVCVVVWLLVYVCVLCRLVVRLFGLSPIPSFVCSFVSNQ